MKKISKIFIPISAIVFSLVLCAFLPSKSFLDIYILKMMKVISIILIVSTLLVISGHPFYYIKSLLLVSILLIFQQFAYIVEIVNNYGYQKQIVMPIMLIGLLITNFCTGVVRLGKGFRVSKLSKKLYLGMFLILCSLAPICLSLIINDISYLNHEYIVYYITVITLIIIGQWTII